MFFYGSGHHCVSTLGHTKVVQQGSQHLHEEVRRLCPANGYREDGERSLYESLMRVLLAIRLGRIQES